MIGAIFGTVRNVKDGVATVITNGVGYEVHVSEPDCDCEEDIPYSLLNVNPWWIHEVAPQDAPHELYGFRTREERDLFRRLLEVQGVGPKVAQRIVANKGVTESKSETGKLIAVESTLRAIRGVGPKLAQRISETFQ